MIKTSFTFGFLKPSQPSNQRLSPGVYSLSARSNIPFARLVGKGVDKTFTWGETVEVPAGQLCSIYNASFHAGDLFINSGCDLDNKPSRITVPVPYTLPAPGTYWKPDYPGDVRTAKRAYLCMYAKSVPAPNTASTHKLIGLMQDGSHNTQDIINFFAVDVGTGYYDEFFIPGNTYFGMLPLGSQANLGDDTRPHALLTTAKIWFDVNNIDFIPAPPSGPNAYYVMEY